MAAILTDASDAPRVRATRCARCGAPFGCGAAAADCWCTKLPPLRRLPDALGASCVCETCLRALIDRESAGPT